MRLRFYRFLWTQAVERGLPLPVILWAEERYLAAMPLGDRARQAEGKRNAEAWDCIVGGPDLSEEAGEEHAAMVDMHDGADCWPSSRGRQFWEA